MTLRAYADRIGVNEQTVHHWKHAAEVAVIGADNFSKLTGKIEHLVAIHAAPKETWKGWSRVTPSSGNVGEENAVDLPDTVLFPLRIDRQTHQSS